MKTEPLFKYSGPVESSKSMVNRALILKALHPNLKLTYQSEAKDVLELTKVLQQFKSHFKPEISQTNKSHQNLGKLNKESISDLHKTSTSLHIFDAGSGGTTFRFLVLYLSKFIGTWTVKMSAQLAQRPKDDLLHILKQLGVTVNPSNSIDAESSHTSHYFQFESKLWTHDVVAVDFQKSSQFFSALALAASDHKSVFTIQCLNRDQSSGYETITLKMLQSIGIEVIDGISTVTVQKTKNDDASSTITIGADWSSVIYLLSFCFAGAQITITNVDFGSYEPDKKGLDFLQQLGLKYDVKDQSLFAHLKCSPSEFSTLRCEIDLTKNPDLFPIMTVLLSQRSLQINSEASLKFPNQLIYKESDRLNAMINVLTQMGFTTRVHDQVLTLSPTLAAMEIKRAKTLNLDSKRDHRLIMSFELLKAFGYKISYLHADEVKKSFANFFEILKGAER